MTSPRSSPRASPARTRVLLSVLLVLPVAGAFAATVTAAPTVFHVRLAEVSDAPLSGRLLVFAKALGAADKEPLASVDRDQIDTHAVAIAAQEVVHLDRGAIVALDADVVAFPKPFSQLEPGRYAVQAVLDRDHSYNYTGRGPGDVVSGVIEMNLPGDAARHLTLATVVPESDPLQPLPNVPAALRERYGMAAADIHSLDFSSPLLSRFWGRQVALRGWVVTPPDYAAHPDQRYPAVYFTHGFGGTLRSLHDTSVARWDEMKQGKTPPMIWVAIDQSSPTGTSGFVDSVNNGPWAQALTAELIPFLERQYRMDATPSGRLLTGHSSGGWAALWLQVSFPRLFGGAWPTAPDPSDFHDFLGVDLYASGANLYREPDGSPRPLALDQGKTLVAIEDYARREVVLGAYGGQMASFDWAFSPRGPDGRPLPMFDRTTGAVDPTVIAYWREHYDVAERLRRHWSELEGDRLDRKIHLTVGTEDQFHLQGAARRLEATMKALGAEPDFRYVEGRGHFDLYTVADDRWGLYQAIAWEMYAVARPASTQPVSAPSTSPPPGVERH